MSNLDKDEHVIDDDEHTDPDQEDIGEPLDDESVHIPDDLDVGDLDALVAAAKDGE